jgi:hypothetical protein
MAILESPPRSQKKKRTGLWITLGIIGGALILLLAIVITDLVVTNHPAAPTTPTTTKETPQEGLTAYATNLQQGNYHAAYQQLSKNYTLKLNSNPRTEAAYIAAESAIINPRGGIKTFKIGTLFNTDVGNGDASKGAKGFLDYTFVNGSTVRVSFLLIFEDSHWKILSEYYILQK